MVAPLSLNLADPKIRHLLGGDSPLATGKTREVVQIAGDHGMASATNLAAGKREVVAVYGDQVMTIDVFAVPGEPVQAHIICPRCHKHSTIRGDHKDIDFDPGADNPVRSQAVALAQGITSLTEAQQLAATAATGRISISAFECSWEVGDGHYAASGVHTGASLCRLRLVIDDNRVRDA